MIYTLTVNPAIDYIMDMGTFPREGATNRALGETAISGGKGINVSLMLKTLGVESVNVGFVAGFTGEALLSALEKEDIKTDFVRLSQGLTRINVKLKSGGDKDADNYSETEINGKGPVASDGETDLLVKKLELTEKEDIIVLSGSLLPNMKQDFYAMLMERVSAKSRASFIVDTSGEALLKTLAFKPLLVKPNLSELSQITGKALSNEGEIEEAAGILISKGAKNVIVSMGSRGAILFNAEDRPLKIPATGGKAVNAVGAGDSMVAGFAAGIVKGMSCEEAFRLGCRAAEATAMCDGIAKNI